MKEEQKQIVTGITPKDTPTIKAIVKTKYGQASIPSVWILPPKPKPDEILNEQNQVVCPRANECGDECFYPIHKTPHQFLEDGCGRITIGHACPACIPVPSTPASEDELSEGLLTVIEMDLLWDEWQKIPHVTGINSMDKLMELIAQAQYLKCEARFSELTPLIEAPLKAEIAELKADVEELKLLNEDCAKGFVKAKAEAYREILDDIEMHCTQYQWTTKPDFTKRFYPFCPTDLHELKAKYLEAKE